MTSETFVPSYYDREVPFVNMKSIVVTTVPNSERTGLLAVNVVVKVYDDNELVLTDFDALRFLREYAIWASSPQD